MSVSFTWKIYNPGRRATFKTGTSSDIKPLKEVFPDLLVSTKDLSKLRAMHAASQADQSLWLEIANRLESLAGDTEREVVLEIGTEF